MENIENINEENMLKRFQKAYDDMINIIEKDKDLRGIIDTLQKNKNWRETFGKVYRLSKEEELKNITLIQQVDIDIDIKVISKAINFDIETKVYRDKSSIIVEISKISKK